MVNYFVVPFHVLRLIFYPVHLATVFQVVIVKGFRGTYNLLGSTEGCIGLYECHIFSILVLTILLKNKKGYCSFNSLQWQSSVFLGLRIRPVIV